MSMVREPTSEEVIEDPEMRLNVEFVDQFGELFSHSFILRDTRFVMRPIFDSFELMDFDDEEDI